MTLKKYLIHCYFCGEYRITFADPERVAKIENGALIQEAFPPRYFDATYREILISSICSKCQLKVFKDPEDEEEPELVLFDAEEDTKEVDEVEDRIREMYEDAE